MRKCRMVEDGGKSSHKVRATFQLEPEQLEELRRRAGADRISQSETVRRALDNYIWNHGKLEVETMRDFERYVIRDVGEFNCDVDLSDETFTNESGNHVGYWNEVVKTAGFDPDEELTICELGQDWNGHRRGSLVVIGLVAEGRSFAIEK